MKKHGVREFKGRPASLTCGASRPRLILGGLLFWWANRSLFSFPKSLGSLKWSPDEGNMPNLLWTALEAHLQSFGRRNFVMWTLIWVNQNFISCISTSSWQWCTPIHHLRYLYLVILFLFQFNPVNIDSPKFVEIVSFKPYNYALWFMSCHIKQ
jgi:hypothetical protein